MAPFGKVHAAMHNAADRVKGGILWASHKYQQGVGLAGKVNTLYDVGKKVAGLMMPTLDKMHPAIAPGVNAGIGALDRLRDMSIAGHDDVMQKIQQNAMLLSQMRSAAAPLQPYMS